MKPVICNYYLTYRCNARCGFCDIWRDTSVGRGNEADIGTIRKNLTDVKRAGAVFVDFTGGEPLLYEDIPEALRAAKETGLRTTVTSNGILYPKRAKELAGKIDILQFSLGGADKESHDSLRAVSCFDRVIESVETARVLGEKPTFIFTVTDDNIDTLEDVIAFSRSLGVLLFINPCFSYPGVEGLSPANTKKLISLSKQRGVTIDRGFLKFVADGGNRGAKPRCRAVSSVVVISPDNKLILPCFHFREKEIPIEDNLYGLLKSQEIAEAKKLEGASAYCEGCTVYCYMRASLFRKPDRYFLPSVLSGIDYLIELKKAR